MPVHLPVVQPRGSIRTDGTRNDIQPADVRGRFARARAITFVALIAVYAVLPWVKINGRPAVLLDVAHRRFFLLGATFNAQDTWLLFFLLAGIGLALVFVTALLGRVWCGWACPQTVFLEGVYRRIERAIEGPREKRLKRNARAWDAEKVFVKAASHAAYLAISLAVAHIFLSYFVPLSELFRWVRASPAQHPEAFAWAFGMTAVMYANFSWFREQTCVVVCPYGRLQSALIDKDSLVVGYDTRRGEPRARGKSKPEGAGDCVDCNRCVVVCPTGIDIRNGLQMDCIGCTACIDACDEVMDKLDRPRGLIRYDSQHGLSGATKRVLRPRVIAYTGVMAGLALVASFALRSHTNFAANVLRLRGAPYTVEEGVVRNAFEVHLVNKRSERVTYEVAPEARAGVTFVVPGPLARPTVEPGGSVNVPMFVTVPLAEFTRGFPVRITVRETSHGGGERVTLTAPFLGPQR